MYAYPHLGPSLHVWLYCAFYLLPTYNVPTARVQKFWNSTIDYNFQTQTVWRKAYIFFFQFCNILYSI